MGDDAGCVGGRSGGFARGTRMRGIGAALANQWIERRYGPRNGRAWWRRHGRRRIRQKSCRRLSDYRRLNICRGLIGCRRLTGYRRLSGDRRLSGYRRPSGCRHLSG